MEGGAVLSSPGSSPFTGKGRELGLQSIHRDRVGGGSKNHRRRRRRVAKKALKEFDLGAQPILKKGGDGVGQRSGIAAGVRQKSKRGLELSTMGNVNDSPLIKPSAPATVTSESRKKEP